MQFAAAFSLKRTYNMGLRRTLRKLFKKPEQKNNNGILLNLYKTNYDKSVLISYITPPFITENPFIHQNYITSHIVAEAFSELGYNIDIVDYNQRVCEPDYNNYAVIFGMGHQFESSFLAKNRDIPRVHFITGAHQDLHNKMSLKSITDFYMLSGLWMPAEANVLAESAYYGMYNADFSIILARGYVYEDCKNRFNNKLHSLNNNILGVFSTLKEKVKRTNNFLFLSGSRQITKGLHLLLEVARVRKDLNFYVVVPDIKIELLTYYSDLFEGKTNVFLSKNLRMDGEEMKNIIESCSYVVAPSYVDGMPGGTIEPMSAGLVPIVSKYCGFPAEQFIFEMDELSIDSLIVKIDELTSLKESDYLKLSKEVKAFADFNFSKNTVKQELLRILRSESL